MGSQADARPALPPCFTGHTEARSSGPGKTVRLVTLVWNINCHSDLPVWRPVSRARPTGKSLWQLMFQTTVTSRDRESTRLNSSHRYNSYSVFFLKKKKE